MRQAQRPLGPAWVAGSVRARNILARRLGRERAHELATSPSLEHALEVLAGTAYGRLVRQGMNLAEAQRAVAETALWHIRILAGWLPPAALQLVRALAAWFELANVEDRLRYLAGQYVRPPFALGALATVWPLVATAQSAAEVRARLAGSPWGDPGTEEPAEMGLALRLSWGRRVLDVVEEGSEWAAGAVALLLARELLVAGRPVAALTTHRPPGVSSAWIRASSLPTLRAELPPYAGWVLEGSEQPSDLWRAEAAWWRRVERDGGRLARTPQMGRPAVIGCVVLLGIDARRTAGALEAAARAGAAAVIKAFDDIG
jgi:hypothetical protein